MLLLLLPHTLSLIQIPTPTGAARQADAGEGKEEAVEGGEVDRDGSGQRTVQVQMCTVATDRLRTGPSPAPDSPLLTVTVATLTS